MSFINEDISTSRTKPLHFTMGFFHTWNTLSPLHNTCKCPEQNISAVFLLALVCIFPCLQVWSQTGPKGQSQYLKWALESAEVTCSFKEEDSIVYCHVPHQTPAQCHDTWLKEDVSPQGRPCTDKSKDLSRNSFLNGVGNSCGWQWSFIFSKRESSTVEVTSCMISFIPLYYNEVCFLCFTSFSLIDFPLILKSPCKLEVNHAIQCLLNWGYSPPFRSDSER